jgi:hypothetical protein
VDEGPRQQAQRDRLAQLQADGNRNGLPQALKSGIESLSGLDMSDVRVHRNSARPAQLQAHAYAQGSDIHLAPGQERHLPHEAWHVVQQKQGRVRATVQRKGEVAINEDAGLEREADAMGALALQRQASGPVDLPVAPAATSVVQMVKYRRKKNGTFDQVPDDYAKKPKEKVFSEDEFLAYCQKQGLENAHVTEIRTRRAKEARKQARAARRARVTPGQMPAAHAGKQIKAPAVVKQEDNAPADLVYRGMSVNNIRNLQRGEPAVFTAQAPTGAANAVDHIVDDSPESPYLSFEAGGLGISAGKYAPKPVDANNKPHDVVQNADGFLKQEKSYTRASRRRHPNAKRIGYVGGIPADAGTERLDVSTAPKAAAALGAEALGSQARRDKAQQLAVADKEVLVKPGAAGIAPAKVPLVASVKEVNEAYYRKHVARQTSRKALAYYKPSGEGAAPVYTKVQIPANNAQYKFDIPEDLRRTDEDSEAEMSDNEDMNLEDYDGDDDD